MRAYRRLKELMEEGQDDRRPQLDAVLEAGLLDRQGERGTTFVYLPKDSLTRAVLGDDAVEGLSQ